MRQIFSGARVFDGEKIHLGAALVVEDGLVVQILGEDDAPEGEVVEVSGGVIAPGFIDLQVNGGAGLMVGASTDLAALSQICASHAGLGSTGILPTLITDTPETTTRVISAGVLAFQSGLSGFLGLHLEGPHLDPRRKGAHDPSLIRPMTDADCRELCEAAGQLPSLMVTVAPCSVTLTQISALDSAGVVVSLGHSDCTYDEARAAISAGARCATHLFNAMSPIGSREPGLVGAILDSSLSAGLIADGIHVAPATLRVALAARQSGLFLVSDAMCVAGTDMTEFVLGGRRILRSNRRLTLSDGTLAGADLSMPEAIRFVITEVGLAPEVALAMASSTPARTIGLQSVAGFLGRGRVADIVHLDDDWRLAGVWKAGRKVLA
jgi:N-acetylglucosamine-6-phosphate deacetylase